MICPSLDVELTLAASLIGLNELFGELTIEYEILNKSIRSIFEWATRLGIRMDSGGRENYIWSF
jgi:hypothetical protein